MIFPPGFLARAKVMAADSPAGHELGEEIAGSPEARTTYGLEYLKPEQIEKLRAATNTHVLAEIERVRRKAREKEGARARRAAERTADQIAATAIWWQGALCIDDRLVFALLDAPWKYLSIGSVSVARRVIRTWHEIIGKRPDLVISVDRTHLHARWRGGRGGLDVEGLEVTWERARAWSRKAKKDEPLPRHVVEAQGLAWADEDEVLSVPLVGGFDPALAG